MVNMRTDRWIWIYATRQRARAGNSTICNRKKQIATKFEKLTHNHTESREDSLISYLRKLKKAKIIDDATLRKILPCGSTPGVLYGLRKVHKPGCPFRPRVSSINTYNYNLASYLVRIPQPISTKQFAIKDSFSFADWAKAHKDNNEMMCSFDVSSSFTNVPLDETVQICLDKLYALLDPPTLTAPLSLKSFAWVCHKEESFHIWWPILWPNRWCGHGLSFRSCLGQYQLKRNGFLTTTFALLFGFGTLTIPSPCLTVKTQQLSFCTTSITVTQTLIHRWIWREQHNPFLGHSHQTPQSYFLNIYVPEEDLYRPVHKMGLLHT